jgi:hypothetical protein
VSKWEIESITRSYYRKGSAASPPKSWGFRVDRYRKYTEYRYTAIRIPVNTGIFNVFFLSQTELLTVEKNQVLTKY